MITTINSDMLLQDSAIKDESIDLLLTDPPYNISEGGATPVWIDKVTGKNKTTIHNQQFSSTFDNNWDAVAHEVFLQQMQDWAKLWFKKMRKGGSFAVFISDQYISYLWKIMEATGFEPKRVWTWKKPAAVPFNRDINPVSACEYVLWGIKPKGKRTFNAGTPKGSIVERYASADKISSMVYKQIKDCSNITDSELEKIFNTVKKDAIKMLESRRVSGPNKDIIECVIPNTITYSGGLGKKIHPTEKPVELLQYFIELLSNEGDLILDTFAGSGSTGVAAHNTKRNSILIEQDLNMFNKMKKRIDSLDEEFLDPALFEIDK
jgi:DNA modification methylase